MNQRWKKMKLKKPLTLTEKTREPEWLRERQRERARCSLLFSVFCVWVSSAGHSNTIGVVHISRLKTLGALLSPFFPKRSGGCAPEAFVVAKQPSAALSVTRRCGALAAFWKVEMFLSRCGADAPGKNERVASIMSAHTALLHLK